MKTRLTILAAVTLVALCCVSCNNSDRKSTALGDNLSEGVSEETTDESATADDSSESRQITMSIDESGLTHESAEYFDSSGWSITFDDAPVGTVKVTMSSLPKSLADLKNLRLPEGIDNIHANPFLAMPLIVASLNVYATDRDEAKRMLDFVARKYGDYGIGVTAAYPSNWSQLAQYKQQSFHKMLTYFDNAEKGGDGKYTVSEPVTMTLKLTNWSYTAQKNYIQIWVKSSLQSSEKEVGVFNEDTDSDGKFDRCYPVAFMQFAHGLAEY